MKAFCLEEYLYISPVLIVNRLVTGVLGFFLCENIFPVENIKIVCFGPLIQTECTCTFTGRMCNVKGTIGAFFCIDLGFSF